MRTDRRKELAAYIAHHGEVTMTELCDAFHVSMNTIRADVAALEETGTVTKVYGGVRSAMQQEVPLFTLRTHQHSDAKWAIARAAARHISDGDTLFLDAGTTTMQVIEALPMDIRLTVVTGNVQVLPQAHSHPNIDLMVMPGLYNRRTGSVSGVNTMEFLSQHHFIKSLMATTGLSADGKLNVSSYLEYEIKRHALQQSDQCILLCDSSKFGASGLIGYGTLSDIDLLITDWDCPDELKTLCERNGTALEIVENN